MKSFCRRIAEAGKPEQIARKEDSLSAEVGTKIVLGGGRKPAWRAALKLVVPGQVEKRIQAGDENRLLKNLLRNNVEAAGNQLRQFHRERAAIRICTADNGSVGNLPLLVVILCLILGRGVPPEISGKQAYAADRFTWTARIKGSRIHDDLKPRCPLPILPSPQSCLLSSSVSSQAAPGMRVSQHIAFEPRISCGKAKRKWLTDVTEFKYYEGPRVKKVYLSAILDLYDRRIVAFASRDTNDNKLVFDTFAKAVQRNLMRILSSTVTGGFQYTNRYFYQRLVNAGMTQSMSRVGRCIDNGPMEGFWGILKRERYYGKRFTNRTELVKMIRSYIHYYNTKRLQRNLGVLTPMEKHDLYLKAA